MRPVPLAASVAVTVAVVDQLTKRWAVERLSEGRCTTDPDACIDLFWTARFNLHYNPGAAFSTGVGFGPVLGLFAFAMVLVLFNIVRGRSDTLGPVLLGAVAGGAIGNLADRIVRADDGFLSGSVVDFIDLQWWPIFNVADAAVVVGIVLFLLYSLLAPDAGTSRDAPPVDDGPNDPDGADVDDSGCEETGSALPDRTPSGG
jgi:signal peptidase II